MSKTYYCHTECYHGNVLWDVGDEYEAEDGEEVPHHFKTTKPVAEEKKKRPMTADAREVPVNEARTLHEMAHADNLDAPVEPRGRGRPKGSAKY